MAKTNNTIAEAQRVNVQFKKTTVWQKILDQKYLIFMSFPFVAWIVIFKYLPLFGWSMAFQDYKPSKSFLDQKWVGLKHFIVLFKEDQFYQALENTIAMSLLTLILSTILSITFAILLNEMKGLRFKKIVQTVSYLPHFVSWVVVANIVGNILSPTGIVNELLLKWNLIDSNINFMTIPNMFWGIVVSSDLWKETGWNAIIYLAAITGIDIQLYEAAKVDGANRFKQILHVTIPCIKPTIIILLIMSIGNLINIGFEKQYLLGNNTVAAKSLVLDKYALDYGIGMFRYSFGTAIGIFKSIVSILLICTANQISKRAGEGSLV